MDLLFGELPWGSSTFFCRYVVYNQALADSFPARLLPRTFLTSTISLISSAFVIVSTWESSELYGRIVRALLVARIILYFIHHPCRAWLYHQFRRCLQLNDRVSALRHLANLTATLSWRLNNAIGNLVYFLFIIGIITLMFGSTLTFALSDIKFFQQPSVSSWLESSTMIASKYAYNRTWTHSIAQSYPIFDGNQFYDRFNLCAHSTSVTPLPEHAQTAVDTFQLIFGPSLPLSALGNLSSPKCMDLVLYTTKSVMFTAVRCVLGMAAFIESTIGSLLCLDFLIPVRLSAWIALSPMSLAPDLTRLTMVMFAKFPSTVQQCIDAIVTWIHLASSSYPVQFQLHIALLLSNAIFLLNTFLTMSLLRHVVTFEEWHRRRLGEPLNDLANLRADMGMQQQAPLPPSQLDIYTELVIYDRIGHVQVDDTEKKSSEPLTPCHPSPLESSIASTSGSELPISAASTASRRRPSIPTSATPDDAPPNEFPQFPRRLSVVSRFTDEECAICKSEFDAGSSVRVIIICQHYFHADCVEEWFARASTCPLCSKNVSVEAI